MLKDNLAQAKQVATWLSDGQTYKSHGKMIDYDEAKNKLQLNVEKIDPKSELWYQIWEIYLRSIVAMKTQGSEAAKLFESYDVSLITNTSLPPLK